MKNLRYVKCEICGKRMKNSGVESSTNLGTFLPIYGISKSFDFYYTLDMTGRPKPVTNGFDT